AGSTSSSAPSTNTCRYFSSGGTVAKILPFTRNDAKSKCGSSVVSGSDNAKRRTSASFIAKYVSSACDTSSLWTRRDDAFERDEVGACALLAKRTQRPVLGRRQKTLRSVHARELDHDPARRLVVAFEHLRCAAANEVAAAVRRDDRGHAPAVVLVRLVVV